MPHHKKYLQNGLLKVLIVNVAILWITNIMVINGIGLDLGRHDNRKWDGMVGRWTHEDPDLHRSIPEMIQARGYECETHKITTQDGYVLTAFRIPPNKKMQRNLGRNGKGSILLQHGLIDSAFTWIFNYHSDQCLPMILSDLGYDVWMGNNRGNRYSLEHIHFSNQSAQFWNFTFDDMARWDVPASIDYILNITSSPMLKAYIGHSQGTIQMFAALSKNYGDVNSKIELFVGLGPVTTAKYVTNLFLRTLEKLHIATILEIFGEKRFLPQFEHLSKLFTWICQADPPLCDNVIEFICGKHKGSFNETRMQLLGTQEPGGTSMKNMLHWVQALKTGRFQMYDYGSRNENQKHYGTDVPPLYHLEDIQNLEPKGMLLIYGDADELADPKDVESMIEILRNTGKVKKLKTLEIKEYAHLDFTWAMDANQRVYKPIIEILEQ